MYVFGLFYEEFFRGRLMFMVKLFSWFKYRIINLLNIFPQTCWANLVSWAQYDASFIEIFNQECRQSKKEMYPHAYCGKCEKTRRYYGG